MIGIVATLGSKMLNEVGIRFVNEHCSIVRFNGAWIDPDIFKIVCKKIKIPILLDLKCGRKKPQNSLSDKELLKLVGNVQMIGLSYVDNAEEVVKFKNRFPNKKVVAKIETKLGLENAGSIILAADLILIDRGDLSTAIGYENVPQAQEKVIGICNELKIPVIVATEMMMSTINNTKPNCADVTDVWLACKQGADFVMLSEETAIGHNPMESIRIMKRIIEVGK